jgi:tetratricopeptide (TPR) repeat protein
VSPSSDSARPLQLELDRVRQLTELQRHGEALAAAAALGPAAADHRELLYLVALNQRQLERIPEALATLERLEQQQPGFSRLYEERGQCYARLQDTQRAIDAFRRGVSMNAALPVSWSMLESLYRTAGDASNAAKAAEQVATLGRLPPQIVHAASLFCDGEPATAESVLRSYLSTYGSHVEALRLLARIGQQRNALDDAERLLEAVVRRAPQYRAARADYARVLIDRQKYSQARIEVAALLELEPANPAYRLLQASVCAGLGAHEQAIALYRELLTATPDWPQLHLLLAHSLKAVGLKPAATESYRAAARAAPSFGDAWWCLANLKTYRFSDDEIARMSSEEAASATRVTDRYHLCFALGKALEDRGEYALSWQYYQRGNALKLAPSRYRPEITEVNTRKQIEVCTAQFFADRAAVGVSDPDPIFIVGLPRTGSTLIEQILASHSQVTGTQELFDISRIVLELQGAQPDPYDPRYPALLSELAPADFRRLGQRYLSDTRAFRDAKPFFIDKMPNNFRHIGLIHLMLPRAKILDVRREPIACCFSNLKQLFASGQDFSYSIENIARYYRGYLELMRHWDTVLPGRVLRVYYEDVVDDLEASVRRILEFCGLAFEPGCMRYHQTARTISTASSEQVRQPIFRDGLVQWRNYLPWLGSLEEALGDALQRYRE